jgi:hypothetical protein
MRRCFSISDPGLLCISGDISCEQLQAGQSPNILEDVVILMNENMPGKLAISRI